MVVERSSVHPSSSVLYRVSPLLLFQEARSEFGPFWPQEWLQCHLSPLQRGQGELIHSQVLTLQFFLESWFDGSIAGSPKGGEVT